MHCILFWLLSVIVSIIIFRFSSDTADKSAEISEGLLAKIIELLGTYISHNFLRKTAHFCEFAALGFSVSGAVRFSFNKRNLLYSLLPCVLYSISDEIHQYFVPGRACRIFDVFVDSCGILTGILVFMLLYVIISKLITISLKK